MVNIVSTLPDQVLVSHKREPDSSKFKKVVNQYKDSSNSVNKPRQGGMWTSTYSPEGDYCCSWDKHLHETDWLGGKLYKLEIKNGLRIIELDNLSDIKEFCREYGEKLGKHHFYNRDGSSGREPQGDGPYYRYWIDFESVFEDGFDGIHLTENGLLESQEGKERFRFDGWSCESTLWLTYPVESFEFLKEHEF